MSLMQRDPSPEQSAASRANSLLSTGPRSERGKAVVSRNLNKPRPFSEIAARSMAALGETPQDFDATRQALAEAMAPRDAWETAWVQDMAILRWRLQHLQRAEAGAVAVRRRRWEVQRRRAAFPPTGTDSLAAKSLVGMVGFTGIPDSAIKFRQVIVYLKQLCDVVRAEMFEGDSDQYFAILYGESLGLQGMLLKAHFQKVAKNYREKGDKATREARIALLADLNQELANYEQLQALYAAEHLEADPVQEDAEMLLPTRELDDIIRYETHLEDLIERRLRQFYARRRESELHPAEATSPEAEPAVAGELADPGPPVAPQGGGGSNGGNA